MASRGQVSENMAYVLLDMPLVPRLDLSDCRPTELPALSETTPTQPPDSASQGSVGRQAGAVGGFSHSQVRPLSAGASEKDRTSTLPPAPVPVPRGIKAQLPPTEVVRTLVVDMRDLNKITAKHTNSSDNNDINHKYNNDEDDSNDEIILEEPHPARSAKRIGGVLKGGGDYVSSGEPRPRPRVSFLLDAAPGQGPDGGGSMQIRVYAKPPQIPHPDASQEEEASMRPNGSSFDQHYHPPPPPQYHQRMGGRPYVDGVVLPTGVSPKRFRRYGSADRRHCASSYRKQISQMQADARLHEAYAAASRSAEGAYRLKPRFHDDYSARTSAPQLPTVSHGGSQSARRLPLFTFKRKSFTDSLLDTQTIITRDVQGRRHVMMSHSGGSRYTKGQHRFQEDPGGERVVSREEFAQLHSRHAEPRHMSASMGNVGSYNIPDPPPPPPPRGGPGGKPPIPRPHIVISADSVDSSPGPRPPRVTSASSRSGRVREWLSVDSVPNYRHKPRPSTVSSASSSTRSRDIHSAQQRLAGPSSRVSSASLKTASDPGPELENMDPVTLNLMARRYRYLAKLKALNLNTPRPLV